MAAQWPRVHARLLALLPTLTGWDAVKVCDGAFLDSPKKYICTVGHSDDGLTTSAGDYSSVLNDDGFQYTETGSVACSLVSFDGHATIANARAALFTLLNELDGAIRADRRLGVLSQEGTCDLSVQVLTTQVIPGAAATALFSLNYFTVT